MLDGDEENDYYEDSNDIDCNEMNINNNDTFDDIYKNINENITEIKEMNEMTEFKGTKTTMQGWFT